MGLVVRYKTFDENIDLMADTVEELDALLVDALAERHTKGDLVIDTVKSDASTPMGEKKVAKIIYRARYYE